MGTQAMWDESGLLNLACDGAHAQAQAKKIDTEITPMYTNLYPGCWDSMAPRISTHPGLHQECKNDYSLLRIVLKYPTFFL